MAAEHPGLIGHGKVRRRLAQADLEAVISISHPSFPMDLAYKELGVAYQAKGEHEPPVMLPETPPEQTA